MDIDALLDEKLADDADFQTSLEGLDETAKEEAIKTKRAEVLSTEFTSLKEQADKATKAEKIAADQKTRAEKAEAEAKALKEGNGTAHAPATPSASDLVALSKVHEDDIERVEKFAKDEGISIKAALQHSELKAILSVRSEERDSAAAANTRPVRTGRSVTTDDALLARANKGEDLSDEDLARVMQLKQKARR